MKEDCYSVSKDKWRGGVEETFSVHLGQMSRQVLVEIRLYGEIQATLTEVMELLNGEKDLIRVQNGFIAG